LRPFLLLSPSAKEEFAHITVTEDEYDSVILGLDPPSLSYERLNIAFRILKNEPISKTARRPAKAVSLIAPHASMYQQTAEDDLPAGLSLGIGPFVKALEFASSVEAELVGKPTRRFFELAIQCLRENTKWEGAVEEVAIVGDDVENDLGGGARELGLQTVLVKTGKYRSGAEVGQEVDGSHETFADFVDALVGKHS